MIKQMFSLKQSMTQVSNGLLMGYTPHVFNVFF